MDPAVDLDNTIITMQTDCKDDSTRKAKSAQSKADAVFNKIKEILQDKRDNFEEDKKLRVSTSESKSSPFLKRILNAIFLAIGIVLLVGVIIVIIYTSFAGRPKHGKWNKIAAANDQSVHDIRYDDMSEENQVVPLDNSQSNPAQYPSETYTTPSNEMGDNGRYYHENGNYYDYEMDDQFT